MFQKMKQRSHVLHDLASDVHRMPSAILSWWKQSEAHPDSRHGTYDLPYGKPVEESVAQCQSNRPLPSLGKWCANEVIPSLLNITFYCVTNIMHSLH